MMKKFSMGMMLSSLLVIQIGCGEEAPSPPAVDTAAAIEKAADAAKDAVDSTADAAKEGADAVQEGADAVKEVAP